MSEKPFKEVLKDSESKLLNAEDNFKGAIYSYLLHSRRDILENYIKELDKYSEDIIDLSEKDIEEVLDNTGYTVYDAITDLQLEFILDILTAGFKLGYEQGIKE